MSDVFKPMIKGKRSTHWYGKVQDPRTLKWTKIALGVTDKAVARKLLRERQERLERASAGMLDLTAEMGLGSVLGAYIAYLRQQGRTPLYVAQIESELLKVFLVSAGQEPPRRMTTDLVPAQYARLDGHTLSALTADAVDAYIARMPNTVSARTRNSIRSSVIGMFSWLVSKRKLSHNPMLVVTRQKASPKRKRRALGVDDLTRLFVAARERPLAMAETVNRGSRKGKRAIQLRPDFRDRLTRIGHERSLVYMTAFLTGLRKNELRSLKVKHITATRVHLPGEYTKNGQDADIPLTPQLAQLLHTHIKGKAKDDRLFNMPRYDALLRCLKKDLTYAGIPYRDDRGRVFDFHSLRKSLGTYLRTAKVDPAVSQDYMRHSDIRLTMETYNDAALHDQRTEVTARLPHFEV